MPTWALLLWLWLAFNAGVVLGFVLCSALRNNRKRYNDDDS